MIVIGASMGGLKAMQVLLSGLPADLPVPVAVVVHRHRETEDLLPQLLQETSRLPVSDAIDKESIQPGHVYLAPADYHLQVESGHFALSMDDPVQYARPSIDVLFESASDVYGPRIIAVMLTGASQDGSRGAARIFQNGGSVLVQEPATAESPFMPAAALKAVPDATVLPLIQIAPKLAQLAGAPITRKL